MDNPEVCVKNLVFGDSDATLSAVLAGVSNDDLSTNGVAVISLFAVVCRLFVGSSVSEITQFVAQVRSEFPDEVPSFVRTGQALIRYALGEVVFERVLLTTHSSAELVRIAARLLIAAIRLWKIDEPEFSGLVRQASEISQGFTLTSAPVEMLWPTAGRES